MVTAASEKIKYPCERYYPSEALKKKLNNYALQTGEYKSELAVRLLKEFFEAKRKENANTVPA
jgi:hypothetical protein